MKDDNVDTIGMERLSFAPRMTATVPPLRERPKLNIDLSSDEDDDGGDDSYGGNNKNVKTRNNENLPPRGGKLNKAPRPSLLLPKASAGRSRARRRSSARFLQLRNNNGQDFSSEHDNEEFQGASASELYKKAIRLNAENRINATNSWNLPLIDNIDQFLMEDIVEEDEEDESEEDEDNTTTANDNNLATPRNDVGPGATTNNSANKNAKKQQRVNFTQASCTLDASIKIYSYRVDDVHLTSYKVLANLNRNDDNKKNGKKSNSKDNDNSTNDGDGDDDNKQNGKSSSAGNTLETNFANINMSKLDSAFDIDPLFHKMSKAFDEGGAKGLLLANLGVSSNGCKIVFDSSESEVLEESDENKVDNDRGNEATSENIVADGDGEAEADQQRGGVSETIVSQTEETNGDNNKSIGMVDISSLKEKIGSTLGDQSIDSLPLVPQLAALRAEFEQLEADGFVAGNENGSSRGSGARSRRFYAADQEEEKEADRSIHQEALERSMAQSVAANDLASNDGSSLQYAPDDLGCGFDDDDDDDDGFVDFIASDENGGRFSGISFAGSALGLQDQEDKAITVPGEVQPSQTAVLLEALTSGGHFLTGNSDYEYFKADTVLSQIAITSGTNWAGAAHWKRTIQRRPTKGPDDTNCRNPAKPARKNQKKTHKERSYVNLTDEPDLTDILLMPPSRKRGSGSSDPLQMTKAALAKNAKTDNVLPVDAGITLEELSSLFLRPKAILRSSMSNQQQSSADNHRGKSVAFNMIVNETFGMGEGGAWDDGSVGGDDDDGAGFCFADDNSGVEEQDFVVEELEGVRKVEKIQIGHASVAKKVDVKRLKRDLWLELETRFQVEEPKELQQEKDCMSESSFEEKKETEVESIVKSPLSDTAEISFKSGVSFQKLVRDLESTKSQVDVTLPFYFICALHLANEKGLRLDATNGLEDFTIFEDNADMGILHQNF